MSKRLAAVALGALAMAVSAPVMASDNPAEDIIKARQASYRVMAWNFGRIKANLEGEYNAKQVEAAANAIAAIAGSGMGALYAPGTETGSGYYPTSVKPEMFTDKEGAAKVAIAFGKASAALASAATGGDQAAVKTAFGDVGSACKACHDQFRQKRD